MAGICSAHRSLTPVSGCKPCNSKPEDIFPDWNEKVRQAKAAGETVCVCGFKYYRTTERCPKCGRPDPNQVKGP